MTLDAKEISAYAGNPERLFLFSMGSTNWGYTNNTMGATYNSIEYIPLVIEMADITQALAEDSPTVDISLDADAGVLQQYVPYQPIEPMRVRVYRHHPDDLDNEYKTELIGEVVSVQFDEEEGMANMSVRMIASDMDRKVPWPVYQKPCNRATYTAGCDVDPVLFATTTTVSAVVENTIYAAAFAEKADAEGDPRWFIAGTVKNNRNGERRFIIGQEGETLYLQAPFVDLQSGDEVTALAGDDRTKETCKDKFNNLNRWLGFKWVPEKNPFTDNVYGTGAAVGPSEWVGGPTIPGVGSPNNGNGGGMMGG